MCNEYDSQLSHSSNSTMKVLLENQNFPAKYRLPAKHRPKQGPAVEIEKDVGLVIKSKGTIFGLKSPDISSSH